MTKTSPQHEGFLCINYKASTPFSDLEIAHRQVPPEAQTQHLDLLEKNQREPLTPSERQALANLRLQADQLTLRKAYAWKVLRWRGRRIPTLQELPLA